MEPEWQTLAAKLREELYHHGALLKMLDDQRTALMRRDAEAILGTSTEMEKQCSRLAGLRDERERFAADVGGRHGLTPPVTVRELANCFPEASRALVEALLSEVNRLIGQTQRRLAQNQILLNRAREMGEHLLFALRPHDPGTTYTPGGAARRPGAARAPNYDKRV